MNLLAAAQKRWMSFNQTQKVVAILICALLIALVAFSSAKFFEQEYVPLLSSLQPQEAGNIMEQLKTMKVPYKLENNGETLMVPKDSVYEVRAELASSGALQGSPGFELFDQRSLGVTDYEQKVDYQRALQGELQRTIAQFGGIDQVRVHLVLPEKSLFIQEQGMASVSVAIKTKPGINLKPDQAKGIMDLVIGSVEGLSPENVHIIDVSTGEVLSDAISPAIKSGGSTQYAMLHQQVKREYEQELENRVQKMMNRVLGPGKAVAMVTAELDFSQTEAITTVYEDGALVSEDTISESRRGENAEGGVPGTESNIPGIPTYTTGQGFAEEYEHEESARSFQPSSRLETVVQPPGSVIRLSTAVIVDGDVTLEQVDEIQTIIATAVGFNADRGDEVVVSRIPFNKVQMEEEPVAAPKPSLIPENLRSFLVYGAAILGVLLIATIILLVLRRRKAEDEIEKMVPIKELEMKEIVKEEAVEFEPEPDLVNENQESARALAKKKPEEVAEVIRVWLAED